MQAATMNKDKTFSNGDSSVMNKPIRILKNEAFSNSSNNKTSNIKTTNKNTNLNSSLPSPAIQKIQPYRPFHPSAIQKALIQIHPTTRNAWHTFILGHINLTTTFPIDRNRDIDELPAASTSTSSFLEIARARVHAEALRYLYQREEVGLGKTMFFSRKYCGTMGMRVVEAVGAIIGMERVLGLEGWWHS